MPEISKESIDNVMFEVDKLEKEVSKLQMKQEKVIQDHYLSENDNGYIVDDLNGHEEVGIEESNVCTKNYNDDGETILVVGLDPIMTTDSEQNVNGDVHKYAVPNLNDEVGSDQKSDMNQQDENFHSEAENNIKSIDMENGVTIVNGEVDEAIVTEEKALDSKSLEDDKQINTEDSESHQPYEDQIMKEQELEHDIIVTNEGKDEEESAMKNDHNDDIEEILQTDNHVHQEMVVVRQGSFVDATDTVDSNKEESWRDMISRGKYTSSISKLMYYIEMDIIFTNDFNKSFEPINQNQGPDFHLNQIDITFTFHMLVHGLTGQY